MFAKTEGAFLYLLCHIVCMTSLVGSIPLGSRTSLPVGCTAPGIAVYNVTFQTFWSQDLFPRQYPLFRPPAQWSKVVGRSHDSRYVLWRKNTTSSLGFTEFAERGTTSVLDLDLQGHGGVFDAFVGANIGVGVGHTSTSLFVDANHPLVSIAAHIVPSPDWFVGLDSETLCSGASWIREKIMDLRIWDAGTDKGFTFTAPNWAEDPKLPISEITASQPNNPACSFYYRDLANLPTMARVTFTRLRQEAMADSAHETIWTPPSGHLDHSAAAKINQPEGMKGSSSNEFFGILADRGDAPLMATPRAPTVPSPVGSRNVGRKETVPKKSGSGVAEKTSDPFNAKPSNAKGSKKKPKLSKEERRKLRRERKAKKSRKGKKGKKSKSSAITPAPSMLVGRKPKDVDCAVSEWSDWSPCSKTCGFGTRSRSRDVTQPSSGRGRKCPVLVGEEMCGTMRGCGWTHFSNDNWSALGK